MKTENGANTRTTESLTKAGNTRKEKFSAVLLMVIGIVYLGLWMVSIFSETGTFMTVNEDKVAISKSELFSHARTFITILLSLTAGIAIFRNLRIGFVSGIAVLVLFFLICSGGLYQALRLGEAPLIVFACAAWLILLAGIILLLLPDTRKRLRVTRPVLISSFVLTIILGLFYFFVQ